MKKTITEKTADWLKIYPIDNTYVRSGKYANDNFSSEEHMLCMDKGEADNYAEMLIKFDISEAYKIDFSEAFLTFYTHQGDKIAYFDIYETENFDEATVTFNTAPKIKDFVKRFSANACCDFTDITEYVKQKVEAGEKEICLCITCDKENPIFKDFSSSRKSVKSKRICLRLLCGEETYTKTLLTDERFGADDPIKNADKLISEYFEHYEKWGSHTGGVGVNPIKVKESEYSFNVQAKYSPEYEEYLEFPSRSIETLEGYEETTDAVDNFGGYLDEQYEATGFFYTKEINGRWYLIDPQGHPYFNAGICTTEPGETRYQRDCILERFGSIENWAREISNRFKTLRIGSTCGASGARYFKELSDPINMSVIADMSASYAIELGTAMPASGCYIFVNNNCMPVFDPKFVDFCEKKAKLVAEQWKDNPYFIGYMSDNEISIEEKTLINFLLIDEEKAENSYCYAFAWRWLSAVTGKKYPSFSDITDEIIEKFRGAVYDRYFYISRAALKKYDPNHLYMGCRFKAPGFFSEEIMRAEGYYCDVCTHNLYFCWEAGNELLANWANWNKKPFIVTEFYTKSADTGFKNSSGAGWICPTQTDRGKFFENYVLKLLESTNCVGFYWFRYMDCDPNAVTNTPLMDVSCNKGMVRSDSTEYIELTDVMYKVCKQAYSLIKFFNNRR